MFVSISSQPLCMKDILRNLLRINPTALAKHDKGPCFHAVLLQAGFEGHLMSDNGTCWTDFKEVDCILALFSLKHFVDLNAIPFLIKTYSILIFRALTQALD